MNEFIHGEIVGTQLANGHVNKQSLCVQHMGTHCGKLHPAVKVVESFHCNVHHIHLALQVEHCVCNTFT